MAGVAVGRSNVRIEAPMSVGELIDKITILEIKSERLRGRPEAANVDNELALLRRIQAGAGLDEMQIRPLADELRRINAVLWSIEDDIRACEAAGDFRARFIELARG